MRAEKSEPALTIVTPVRDPGPEFSETAACLLQQSFDDWEWILVDAGAVASESGKTLHEYASRDSRIRVVRPEKQGSLGAARNVGVAEARSGLVAFLDSGDLIVPTTLEKWFWYLESRPHYAMVKAFEVGVGDEQQARPEGLHSPPEVLRKSVLSMTSMMRRDVYLAVGGMNEQISDERAPSELWLRCTERGYSGGTIPECLEWNRSRDVPSTEGKPRRLLILVPHLAMGGADKFGLDLMAELISKHSFGVTVVATGRGPHAWRSQFESLTPDIFTLDTFLLRRDAPAFLNHLIRSRGIDSVLVTQSELGYRLLPALRAENPGAGFYDYVHMEDVRWTDGGYPAMSVANRAFLDRTAASSHHLKNWMVEHGAEPESIAVVSTNIDTELWRRDRFDAETLCLKWDVDANTPVILFAGRLSSQKQPEVLTRTLQLLDQRGISYACLIAGEGEQEPKLREFIARNESPGVRLLGLQSNEHIKELLAISDIFFLPSKHEGIALSIYEAMSMGVVPVSADVGGQRELVTSESGVLIPRGPDEAERYADALASLLNDAELRRRMAGAARKRVVESFRLEQMGDAMAALLRERRQPAIENSTTSGLWTSKSRVSLLETLAMVGPLFTGQQHAGNRRLLMKILRHAPWRRKLIAQFDGGFYGSENPDVPKLFPFNLLHYVFYGYREGRLPSPSFDEQDFMLRFPEVSTNPLLYSIAESRSQRDTVSRSRLKNQS